MSCFHIERFSVDKMASKKISPPSDKKKYNYIFIVMSHGDKTYVTLIRAAMLLRNLGRSDCFCRRFYCFYTAFTLCWNALTGNVEELRMYWERRGIKGNYFLIISNQICHPRDYPSMESSSGRIYLSSLTMVSFIHSFILSFILSFFHSFTHSLNPLFIHSFIRLFVLSFTYSFFYSSFLWFILSVS